MKRFLLIVLGMVITLMAMALFSFKQEEKTNVSYAMVCADVGDVFVFYGNGLEEKASSLLGITVGNKASKGEISVPNATMKTLEYMHLKGYKVIGESQYLRIEGLFQGTGGSGHSLWSYTLIKEN